MYLEVSYERPHPLPTRAVVFCHLPTTAKECADHSPSSQALQGVSKPQQLVLFTKKKKIKSFIYVFPGESTNCLSSDFESCFW